MSSSTVRVLQRVRRTQRTHPRRTFAACVSLLGCSLQPSLSRSCCTSSSVDVSGSSSTNGTSSPPAVRARPQRVVPTAQRALGDTADPRLPRALAPVRPPNVRAVPTDRDPPPSDRGRVAQGGDATRRASTPGSRPPRHRSSRSSEPATRTSSGRSRWSGAHPSCWDSRTSSSPTTTARSIAVTCWACSPASRACCARASR